MLSPDRRVDGYHYRTSGGGEIDLVLRFPDGRLWAVEVKRSLKPSVARGFHSASEDLTPERRIVVYPGDETYPMRGDVEAMPLATLCEELIAAH